MVLQIYGKTFAQEKYIERGDVNNPSKIQEGIEIVRLYRIVTRNHKKLSKVSRESPGKIKSSDFRIIKALYNKIKKREKWKKETRE